MVNKYSVLGEGCIPGYGVNREEGYKMVGVLCGLHKMVNCEKSKAVTGADFINSFFSIHV